MKQGRKEPALDAAKEHKINMEFSELELSEPVRESLARQGFVTATPIQEESLPDLLKGRDLVGKAETGSGKTLAFGIPLIEKVEASRVSIQALVILPTRELAQQVALDLEELGKEKGVKVALVTGGVHIRTQRMRIPGKQVVVGTPGRLIDLLEDRFLPIEWVEYFVLDEFDRLLDMGFLDDIKRIVKRLPRERQTALFSATAPQEIMKHARGLIRDPVYVEMSTGVVTAANAEQRAIRTKSAHKIAVLEKLLEESVENDESVIIFCNTKRQVRQLDRELWGRDFSVAAISGDYEQSARFKVIERFRNLEVKILVATDVAARGLDIDHIGHVINYDAPFEVEDYVHRIGRTARAGRDGLVTTLVGDQDAQAFRRIVAEVDQDIEMIKEPGRPGAKKRRPTKERREAIEARKEETVAAPKADAFGTGLGTAEPAKPAPPIRRRTEAIYADQFDDQDDNESAESSDASSGRARGRGRGRSRRDETEKSEKNRGRGRSRRSSSDDSPERDRSAPSEESRSSRGRRGERSSEEERSGSEAEREGSRSRRRSRRTRDDEPRSRDRSRDEDRSSRDSESEDRGSRSSRGGRGRGRGRDEESSERQSRDSAGASGSSRRRRSSSDEGKRESSGRGRGRERNGRRSRHDHQRWEEEQLKKPTGLITDDFDDIDETESLDLVQRDERDDRGGREDSSRSRRRRGRGRGRGRDRDGESDSKSEDRSEPRSERSSESDSEGRREGRGRESSRRGRGRRGSRRDEGESKSKDSKSREDRGRGDSQREEPASRSSSSDEDRGRSRRRGGRGRSSRGSRSKSGGDSSSDRKGGEDIVW